MHSVGQQRFLNLDTKTATTVLLSRYSGTRARNSATDPALLRKQVVGDRKKLLDLSLRIGIRPMPLNSHETGLLSAA